MISDSHLGALGSQPFNTTILAKENINHMPVWTKSTWPARKGQGRWVVVVFSWQRFLTVSLNAGDHRHLRHFRLFPSNSTRRRYSRRRRWCSSSHARFLDGQALACRQVPTSNKDRRSSTPALLWNDGQPFTYYALHQPRCRGAKEGGCHEGWRLGFLLGKDAVDARYLK